jgi:prevent-host-death family protein
MTVTAKELRFNTSMLFEMLEKGEEIVITFRGKEKARLTPVGRRERNEKEDYAFGVWRDRQRSVEEEVRTLRKGREFDA